MFHPNDFFDLTNFQHKDIFRNVETVWDVLPNIAAYIAEIIKPERYSPTDQASFIGEQVFIGADTVIEPNVIIKGPAIIGAHCTIAAGAYIREHVIVADNAVVGHTSELKNCILMEHASAPHFSYVGDSILGQQAHLGAGVKVSNFKLDHSKISLNINDQKIETNLRKFGAIIGDEVEIGCNAVLNPGTLIGPRTTVYPAVCLRGYIPANSIVKLRQSIQIIAKRK